MTQAQADALEWIKQVQSDFADMQVEVSADGLRPPAHVVLSIDLGAFSDPQEKCLTCGKPTFLRLTTSSEPLPLCIDHAEESVRVWHAHLQALDFAASMRELGADATVEVVSSIDELPSGHAKHLRHLRAQMDETRQWQHTARDNFEAALLASSDGWCDVRGSRRCARHGKLRDQPTDRALRRSQRHRAARQRKLA